MGGFSASGGSGGGLVFRSWSVRLAIASALVFCLGLLLPRLPSPARARRAQGVPETAATVREPETWQSCHRRGPVAPNQAVQTGPGARNRRPVVAGAPPTR